jgi:uncharacterized membrane protein
MDYLALKTLHILSASILFGTGLGTAYFMWAANRSNDPAVIASTAHRVAVADWAFTTPTVIFQPLSGLWLAHHAGFAWNDWLSVSLVLYGIAGACWLPVVWLQLRMRDMARFALHRDQSLPPAYWRLARIWFWLGVPAFLCMVAVFFLMVFKHL